MEIQFKVSGVISDKTEEHIVILKDDQNQEILPIWVGSAEGDAIRFVLEHVHPSRPMSHDLLRNILDHFSMKVERIVIHDIKNATFFAHIHLSNKGGGELIIDARPSDAIALALRSHAPIFVTEEVLKKKSFENIEGLFEKFNTKESGG
jgi:bifunctional DNase/RNase